jgi:2-keto-4-pentenoate hydratase
MDLKKMALSLIEAEKNVKPLEKPFTAMYPEFSLAEAYEIQTLIKDEKIRGGRKVIGKKIGFTGQAMRKQFGINQPDYGNLFDNQIFNIGVPISTANLIDPKIEGEIAFILKDDLAGPYVTISDVCRATYGIMASIELLDSRFGGQIKFEDSIADNATACGIVLGSSLLNLEGLDLRYLGMFIEKNGLLQSSGTGVEVMGNPLAAVAWLANKLSEHGTQLQAGDIILSGAITGAVSVNKGDVINVSFSKLGNILLHFE